MAEETKFEHWVECHPSRNWIRQEPNRNYGITNMKMVFYLRGPKGAVFSRGSRKSPAVSKLERGIT